METVIFDMDGVIFDSERACLSCWSEIAEKWGLDDVEQVFRKCIGTNDYQTRMIVEESYAPKYGAGISEKLLKESSRIWHLRYDENALPGKAGVVELLEFLKENNVAVGLASSTKKASVERELKQAGLYSYFDSIIGGDAVKISKPDPEIYLLACREMGVEPKDATAIEDSYNGIRSAYAAGMRPIMVPDMIPADDEMRRLAAVICRDLPEVKKIFEKEMRERV
ncbi:MAG: HAD family phosphatase [Lachnospiraceae bacterium]|nr:HAD family phosphatase [Lachnospiraceae bacterium]